MWGPQVVYNELIRLTCYWGTSLHMIPINDISWSWLAILLWSVCSCLHKYEAKAWASLCLFWINFHVLSQKLNYKYNYGQLCFPVLIFICTPNMISFNIEQRCTILVKYMKHSYLIKSWMNLSFVFWEVSAKI